MGDAADALALIVHQPDRLRFEVVIEAGVGAGSCGSSLPSVWTSYPPFGKCPLNRIKPTSMRLETHPRRLSASRHTRRPPESASRKDEAVRNVGRDMPIGGLLLVRQMRKAHTALPTEGFLFRA
jgi:hypothetical protein